MKKNYEQSIGQWKNGLLDGIGKRTYADGKIEEGKFMINVYIGKE